MSKKYFKLQTDEDIAKFVSEWQREGMLVDKALCEASGKGIKEILQESGEWEQFVKDCEAYGYNPEVEISEYQQKLDNLK